jgi:hypothetical protein
MTPTYLSERFVRALVPDYVGHQNVTVGEIFEWIWTNIKNNDDDPSIYQHSWLGTDFAMSVPTNCSREVCAAARFTGNPDLVGIGVCLEIFHTHCLAREEINAIALYNIN